MKEIVQEDLAYIFSNFDQARKLRDATILVTGCAGFLGFYLMQFFARFAKEFKIKRIIGLDTFLLGESQWIKRLKKEYPRLLNICTFDIAKDDLAKIKEAKGADFIIHMASIASPTFYRKYPIETIDANVWGLRRLLDFYKKERIRGLLFFSSSEVYGDPHEDFIPTSEDYRGHVASIGPRACYDEAKRFGETLCYVYAKTFSMPISIVRPFNNYGPGMKLDDKRVPADFARAVANSEDIVILSDGTPTRTFCYVSDAITGYLKALTFGEFEYFNVGIEEPEISIKELAHIFQEQGRKVFDYKGNVIFMPPQEKEYLEHNPSRRRPSIEKSRKLLNYNPSIRVHEGVERFLRFIKTSKKL